MAIKLIISDFDGTLVDTFEANLYAYQEAFAEIGVKLTAEQYRERFGFRIDRLALSLGIMDDSLVRKVKEKKAQVYPKYFHLLKLNKTLIELIKGFRTLGGKTALASTARKINLMNVVKYLGIGDCFDLILTGEDVTNGKPSPEIFQKAMNMMGTKSEETLIFEDSNVGIEAAKSSKAHYMIVDSQNFEE